MFQCVMPEGENQVSDLKEQSTCLRTILRCSAILPRLENVKDAEGKSKTVIQMTREDRRVDRRSCLITPTYSTEHNF